VNRLTALLVISTVFLFIPVANALASPTITVNVSAFGGSGEVSGVEGYESTCSPPIKCHGPPKSGQCEGEVTEEFVS